MLKEVKTKTKHYFVDRQGWLQGECKQWDNDGKLFQQSTYVDGQLNGEYKTWHKNGQLHQHCFYQDDKRHGEYKSWNTSNKIEVHCFYVNGEYTPFSEIMYPKTPEKLAQFRAKHDLPLLK